MEVGAGLLIRASSLGKAKQGGKCWACEIRIGSDSAPARAKATAAWSRVALPLADHPGAPRRLALVARLEAGKQILRAACGA